MSFVRFLLAGSSMMFRAGFLLLCTVGGCRPSAGTAHTNAVQSVARAASTSQNPNGSSASSAATGGPQGVGSSFRSVLDATLCLDVAGDVSQDGQSVVVTFCAPTSTQSWQLTQGRLQTQGRCVDVSGAHAVIGAQLELAECAADDVFAQWTFSTGQFQLAQSGLCLALPSASAQAGQAVQLATCVHNANTQLFEQQTSGSSADPNTAARRIDLINHCSQSLYVNNGVSSYVMAQNTNATSFLPYGWKGRMWARSDCAIIGASATCSVGIPLTLAEYAFDGYANLDYYDISLVDGFNVTMAIAPQGGHGSCHAPVCSTDILASCAADLQQRDANNKVIACLSGCSRYHTDADCCQNANNTPATCPQPPQAAAFKQACPDAYSYPYDDSSSTWTCSQPSGYTVTFCPP